MTCLLKTLKANLLNVSDINEEWFTSNVLGNRLINDEGFLKLEETFPIKREESAPQTVGSLIGEYERFHIQDIKYESDNRCITIIFETKDMIVNDSRNTQVAAGQGDYHNLRACFATRFKMHITYNRNLDKLAGVSVWRSRETPAILNGRENDRLSYGGGGYYHCGTELCQGSWAQTLFDYADTPELPVIGLVNIVVNALIHRNEGDSAGNGLSADYLFTTQSGKYIEREGVREILLEHIESGAVVSPWGAVTIGELKGNIERFKSDFGVQLSFDDFFTTPVTEDN